MITVGGREPVQHVSSVCYDLGQQHLGYEGGGQAASGEGGEDDDQADVWSNAAGEKNE